MTWTDAIRGDRTRPATIAFSLCSLSAAALAAACNSSTTGTGAEGVGASCTPGDADGVNGGDYPVLVDVGDTGFAVGGIDSGSTERNIAFDAQNHRQLSRLTLTNVGTRSHDLAVQCIPSGLPPACAQTRRASPTPPTPGRRGYTTLVPAPQRRGKSATVTFVTPAVEGVYTFVSNEPGDTETSADGGLSGLVGAFVLM